MAKPAAHTYHKGEMEITEHVESFHGFLGLMKWCGLAIVTAVLFLATWLCAHAGFLQALILAVIVLAIGITVLRSKPAAAH
jgi:hypothetical protein